MSRYIDADALEYDTEWSEYHDGFTAYSQMAIDTAPSIDLDDYVPKDFHDKTCEAMAKAHQEEIADILERADVDRPQGEWINKHEWANGFYERECSICGAMKPILMHTAKVNFCPNCGARMKGEDDE